MGEDHRGEGEQDWDGEVVDVCVQDVCQCHIAPRPNTKYEVPNRISKKVQGNVVLGSRVVAGTLGEERQGGESEQEAKDWDGEGVKVGDQELWQFHIAVWSGVVEPTDVCHADAIDDVECD